MTGKRAQHTCHATVSLVHPDWNPDTLRAFHFLQTVEAQHVDETGRFDLPFRIPRYVLIHHRCVLVFGSAELSAVSVCSLESPMQCMMG